MAKTANDDQTIEEGAPAEDKKGSVHALTALNLFIGDVQTGMGPYVTLFLKAQQHWNPAQIGTAIAAGNLAQVLAQTPLGAAIDRSHRKRLLIIGGAFLIAAGGLLIALLPRLPFVIAGQSMIGVAGSVFPPCIAAIALGLVGRSQMDKQTGRNQTFNAGGRVLTALMAAGLGYFFGLRSVLFLLVALSAAAIICVSRVREGDINQALARGADGDEDKQENKTDEDKKDEDKPQGGLASLGGLLKDRAVLKFLAVAVTFQAANAALIPLVTQSLSGGRPPKLAVLFTAGFVIAAQAAAVLSAAAAGKLAKSRGRKPILLLAFGTLALLAVLLTLSRNPFYLIGVQSLGGVCIGLFGVTSVLIIADLTKGTGNFNAAQGAIASAQGIGSFTSNSAAGLIARHAGQHTAFLTLAAVAAFGLVFSWRFFDETRKEGEKDGEGEDDGK